MFHYSHTVQLSREKIYTDKLHHRFEN